MKAKITARKLRFLMLCLTVLFSVMGISFNAAAESTCTHPNLSANGWTVVEKTTCQGAGYKTQWCYDCGETVKEELPYDEETAPHVKGEWKTIKVPTCQSEGEQVIYCYYGCKYEEDCAEGKAGELIVLERRTLPAHNYQVIFSQAPTCISEGYEFVACLDCYDMKSVTLPPVEGAHGFTEWYITKDANCKDEGELVRECLYCGATESKPFLDSDKHINIVWEETPTKPATCDAPGYKLGICDGCGMEIREEIPQHSQSAYSIISTTESTCSVKGIERRSCVCGYDYDVELQLEPENHVYGEWEITKQPTCTDGSRYKHCIYHYKAQIVEAIPSNGEHNYGDWVVVTEPGCSKTGLEKKTCLDCAEGTEGHEITRVLPTKHDYGTWTVIADMSCNEKEPVKGTKLAKCDECNFEKHFTIPAVHSFTEWRVVSEADCKEPGIPGKMERICQTCKKVETKEYYEEHEFTDWYVTGKPVCAKNGESGRTGLYTRWCLNCKKTEHKAIGVNHEFVDVVIDKYPECAETGLKTVKCKFCDETKQVAIPQTEHKFGEWKVITESTCEKRGEKVHVCVLCGYEEKAEIPAHSFGNWMYGGKKLDCSATINGSITLKKYCSVCGAESAESKTITAMEHPNKITVVTEATCTTSGNTTEYCPDCGKEVIGEITPAKGHTLDIGWTEKAPATCTSEGSRYKACADCDYIEFQKVARTEHALIETQPGLAPTCTTGGYSAESLCVVCKAVFPSKQLEPLGHNIPEGSEICSVCKAYKDTDCGCACHSTTGMEALFFKLINKLYQMFGINQQCSCGVLHYDEPGFFAKLFGKA